MDWSSYTYRAIKSMCQVLYYLFIDTLYSLINLAVNYIFNYL